ncbi:Oidioi.mRNA.OKI2018_I69.chr1.g374.t1.cds [Oikopleura dioica]|uniref:Oidioi.mRNA.OKI2018_I69.chr1.g374.t1.cds n=1 Tax=Oikopleura dioica TaxID=34765 RepID=A0ABN7SP25_OIKDI|nr:Oidioi.mRNA.OKI2018_I69.chr1.g374.t1.cds [Oikopleura dioica]
MPEIKAEKGKRGRPKKTAPVEEKLSRRELIKYEFNMLFSLLRATTATESYQKDFCVTTAASCIRGSKQFGEYLEDRRKEVREAESQQGESAFLLAEERFLKICEKIQQSKDDRILRDRKFLSEVQSLNTSVAAKHLYETSKGIYIDLILPHLNNNRTSTQN